MEPDQSRPRRASLNWPQILFFLILILITTFLISRLPLLRAAKPAHKGQALKNLKEIGAALLDFEEQYGDYPSERTAALLKEKDRWSPSEQESANFYLAQLLASKSVDTETIFYLQNHKGFRKGDDRFETADEALEKGENSFGYVMLTNRQTVHEKGATYPIVTAPLARGGTDPRFNDRPFDGHFIYLRNDTSAVSGKIAKDGKGEIKGRRPFALLYDELDPETQLRLDVKMPR